MKIISKSLDDTKKAARLVLSKLKLKSSTATTLFLEGDLGSGKTTFTQALAKELGVKNHLTSPTFVLIKSYQTNNPIFKKLIHIDAYRLNQGQDLLNLGWSELTVNPDNLIVLEWPERVTDIFTGTEYKINFKFIDEKTREISWKSEL